MKLLGIMLAFPIVNISAMSAEMVRDYVEFPPTSSIVRASFDCWRPKTPDAVLVLLPGANGDGAAYLKEKAWVRFATKLNWAVVGVTFVSPMGELIRNGGYYDVTVNSGMMLHNALARMELTQKPLYLYGFSGGGKFAACFANVYPESVAAFAVLGMGNVHRPSVKNGPRGIIACGEDDYRLGAALSWFKAARALGWKLSWVEVPDISHVRNVPVEEFIRQWFISETQRRVHGEEGVFCEIGSGSFLKGLHRTDSNCSWFPSQEVGKLWRSLFWRIGDAQTARTNKAMSVASPSPATLKDVLFSHEFKTKFEKCPKITLYGRVPNGRCIKGVLCLSLLANNVEGIAALINGDGQNGVVGEWLRYAGRNDLAILAWGAPRGLWRPRYNWNEIDNKEKRGLGRAFHSVAIAWKIAVDFVAREYSLPATRCFMVGFSGAGQFAQRLALHLPEKFAAVAIHVPSSFDYPVQEGRRILWCLTTGENEGGYERSLKFVKAAKENGYPIVYKAYPGLGHTDSMFACKLAQSVFDYVIHEDGVDSLNSERWPFIADYVNQQTARRTERTGVQEEFSIYLPNANVETLWRRE